MCIIQKNNESHITEACRLCGSTSRLFSKERDRVYYSCKNCSAVFMSPASFVRIEDEKKRYTEHNNDVEDSGYQKFVQPIVLGVQQEYGKEQRGLDFGSGTGPVVTKLLTDIGYKLELYDPFFCDRKEVLLQKYDFIVCCEVIEHFRFPYKEFKLLRSLLNPGGTLYCMTDLYSEDINFKRWYYKDDPTHVFFYHKDTFNWIKSEFRFSFLKVDSRLVRLSV